jgi:transcriptional regulator with XRE-family HTH domain
MELHKFLNDARERKGAQDPMGMSKYRVAKLIGITVVYACRIFNEPTNPSEEILRKICGVLDIEYHGVVLKTEDGEVWEEEN